ncbi:MAG: DinB family protein [Chloroflexi bacterium]|nr:DinB family protein [Chloroflexota bacterium]
MSLPTFLSASLKELHESLDAATNGLTPEQLHWRPGGRANHIAFSLWHYVRTQDNVVRFVLQRRPTVWMEGKWHERFGLDLKAQGTGMTPEDAANLRISSLGDFRTYMRQVFQESEAYVANVKEADLDRVQLVKPLGEMPMHRILGRTLVTHGFSHLGEIWAIRGAMGLSGSPV